MKRILFLSLLSATLLAAAPRLQAQEPQQPDANQIINNQLENLSKSFKLDDVQIFFVDSILQHNYPAMMDEFERTKKTGASNGETYQIISDKWMAATDEALQKVFTEDQWTKYLKSAYGKEKKRRDKRIRERGGIL
jgi:hypothetical protein